MPRVQHRLTVDEMLHAVLPVIQSVQKGPSDAHGGSSQAERFQYIRTPSYASINVNLQVVKYLGRTPLQHQVISK